MNEMKWNKVWNEMKWCEIKYEMQMSYIELKSIESAFVEGNDNVEYFSKRENICKCNLLSNIYYSVIHLVRIYDQLIK